MVLALSQMQQLKLLQRNRELKKQKLALDYPELPHTLNISPIFMQDAQQLAAELNVTIFDFYQHSEGWVVFVITARATKIINLPEQADDAIINSILWAEKFNHALPAQRSSIREKRVLRNLFDALFEPLQRYLKQGQQIIITAHANLHYAPVNLALSPDGRYLFEKYEIFHMDNMLSIRQEMIKKREISTDQVLPHNQSVLLAVDPGRGKSKLTFTTDEVAAVRAVFRQAKLLRRPALSPVALVATANAATYSVLHFSCHGRFDPYQPSLSGLALNGTLTVERITNELFLKGYPMVVLSACETGLSRVTLGDEKSGLNQALLLAGAGSVISSLWSVNDRATMVLFQQFYQFFSILGERNVSALTKAMQTVKKLNVYESAYFWGAFVLYGLPNTERI